MRISDKTDVKLVKETILEMKKYDNNWSLQNCISGNSMYNLFYGDEIKTYGDNSEIYIYMRGVLDAYKTSGLKCKEEKNLERVKILVSKKCKDPEYNKGLDYDITVLSKNKGIVIFNCAIAVVDEQNNRMNMLHLENLSVDLSKSKNITMSYIKTIDRALISKLDINHSEYIEIIAFVTQSILKKAGIPAAWHYLTAGVNVYRLK